MKTLNLHVDYIKFKPLKKALNTVEPLSELDKKEKLVKEALVVLTAVEKTDILNEILIKKFIDSIKDIAKQVNTKRIVLYPYAHLSSNLSSPEIAMKILMTSEKELSKQNFEVIRAPFGYYKEFELKVKGHPLSELSREIGIEERIKKEKIEEETEDLTEEQRKRLLREISKSKLDTSKLKENDHRILGQQMDLWSFNDVAPGMVFWHNNGLIIYNELIRYWEEMHKKNNYELIRTPQIMDAKLWKVSGHWEKFRENMFLTDYEKRNFCVKPMNCPGGMLVYRAKPKTYKDLPLRVGELGIVHRQELSGVLAGLFRVIQLTQDDAHIFCANENQVEQETNDLIDLIEIFYKTFNLKFDHVELSTRPEKRIGSDELWNMAEEILEKVLKKRKMKYKLNPGEGAFYGPKIDFHAKDSQGRTWQLSTIQLDFAMPERFELEYIDKNNERKRPIMLHRVIYGSLERFIGVLLESSNGRLPTWLSPIQIRILS
ncbi:threonine--tRNA ligase, partial [Candidatus Pacearchaeota archaeon]|nr:threonine--tRNA ligase [Candidatus Pacearchaeota archaeon]